MIKNYLTYSVTITSNDVHTDTIKIRNLNAYMLKEFIENGKYNNSKSIVIDFAVNNVIDYLFKRQNIEQELVQLNNTKRNDWVGFFKNHTNYNFFKQFDCSNTDDMKRAWIQWSWKGVNRPIKLSLEEFYKVCFYYAFYISPIINVMDSLNLTGHIEFNNINNKSEPTLKSYKQQIFDKLDEEYNKLEEIVNVFLWRKD